MRILYIVTAFPRWTGDVITPWLTETIHRLDRVGVSVEVLVPAYHGLGNELLDGIRVHRFRYAPAAWETLSHVQTVPDRIRERPIFLGLVPSYLASGSLAAAKLARTQRFDAVHAFWPVPHSLFGLAAKYAGGPPLVSTFFGVELTWLRSQWAVLVPVLAAIVKHSDAVTAISSYTAGMLRELVPSAVPVLVPFGAAIGESEIPATVSRVDGDSEHFTLLFVGRLVERKGVHVLIDAVQKLRAARNVKLDIVGDGPLRPVLEAQVAEQGLSSVVRFHGQLPDEEVRRQYSGCDAFILPAVVDAKGDTEGLGVVLIEALLHGKPVIASHVGGIPDIVRDGATGLLVQPGDAGALAQAVARYISEPGLAQRLARAGREHVSETFAWDRITERLVLLYSRLVSQQRS